MSLTIWLKWYVLGMKYEIYAWTKGNNDVFCEKHLGWARTLEKASILADKYYTYETVIIKDCEIT